MSVLPDFTMRRVRLADAGPGAQGLSIDSEGLHLGACTLIAKRAGRFAPRGRAVLDHLLLLGYGEMGDGAGLHDAMWPIARKLDDGDLTGAMIRALLLGLPDLPDEAARLRLESAEDLFKLGFDPNQPRDEDGRWSDTGASAAVLRHAFDTAHSDPLPNGVQVADADGYNPAMLTVGNKGHQFRFVLNNRYESALECTDCGAAGKSFPAFSGLRSTGAVDDAAQTTLADEGAIPIGRYLIVDRAQGRREQALSMFWDRKTDWFALVSADTGDDSVFVDGVERHLLRLHPIGTFGMSEGCITVTDQAKYQDLHQMLSDGPVEYLPGTRRRVYGVINVVRPANEK